MEKTVVLAPIPIASTATMAITKPGRRLNERNARIHCLVTRSLEQFRSRSTPRKFIRLCDFNCGSKTCCPLLGSLCPEADRMRRGEWLHRPAVPEECSERIADQFR